MCMPFGALASPIPHMSKLKARQFSNQDNQMNISPVFIVVGALVVIAVLLAVGGFFFRWRRREGLIYRQSPGLLPGPGIVSSARYRSIRKAKPLTRAELDEIFPAKSYDKFLMEYNAELKLQKCESLHSENGDHHENTGDLGSLRIEEDPKFVCAICQTSIGHEDDDEEPNGDTATKVASTELAVPEKAAIHNDVELEKVQRSTGGTPGESPAATGEHVLVRQLSCHHVFHDECIVPWLTTKKASCPLCQHSFIKNEVAGTDNTREAPAGTNRTEGRRTYLINIPR